MCKRVICLTIVGLLGLVPAARAELVGWWKLDEGTGTTVTDASGNGINGTFVGNPVWADGMNDSGGLELDGKSWLDFGNPPKTLFTDTAPLSIALWIYPTNLGTALATSGHDRAFVARNMNYAFKSSGPYARFTTPGVLDYNAQKTVLKVGEWQHVAVAFQPAVGAPGLAVFYLDGVETDRVNSTTTANGGYNAAAATAGAVAGIGGPFFIGNNQWATNQMYFGRYDDIRLYNHLLTAAEVKALALRPKAYKPNPADEANAVGLPLLQWTAGTNAMLHNVYVGTSPELTEANLVGPRQPFAMYYHTPGIAPGVTYYWRVDEIAADGTITTGDVWSFIAQALTAYYPRPANGANDAPIAPVLTWLPGQAVIEHQVYFSANRDAVAQAAAGASKGVQKETTFTPGPLEPLTEYFWRVDELAGGGVVRPGEVWSFTTCQPVDDFEGYTDDDGGRIYETWIDGWTNKTGSQVGNLQAPFAERTIVYSGKQAMPMDYNNVNAPFYSEAQREFTPVANWTTGGAGMLVLYVRGNAGNAAAPLYIALEDSTARTAVLVHPDPAIVKTTRWTAWRISFEELSTAGVNLARIKKLSLGIGDRKAPVKGGAGRIYVDDIQLTKAGN